MTEAQKVIFFPGVPTQHGPSVVTPGNHDGVHLGHRALIGQANVRAQELGARTLALCFDPHPTAILNPERTPVLLTSIERRVELLKDAGCDEVIVLPFDEPFAKTPPQVFVQEVLVRICKARGVVVGPDFRFGHERAGTIETLKELGQKHQFSIDTVPPVEFKGEAVSSTRIRATLAERGAVDDAAQMMLRVHDVDARVIRGDGRGKQLGFATANLQAVAIQLPHDGVYAVVGREQHRSSAELLYGVANLGTRPTFGAGRSFEVHFFNFDGDLYDKTLRIGFASRIRDEQRFPDVNALRRQIEQDCERAKLDLQNTHASMIRWI